MTRSKLFRSCLSALALALLATTACTDLPTATLDSEDSLWDSPSDQKALRILTWNAYLGGDTGPLFSLDFNNVPAVLAAVNTFWAQVETSDIDARMGAIADEIEAKRPHVVSLQEVVRFAVVDMTTGAVVGGADLLASLQNQLAARGLDYEVVAVQENTSSALPLEVDMSTFQITKVLSFTDRVVSLRRGDVTVTHVEHGTYDTAYDLGPLMLKRGYIRTSFRYEKQDYHVFNTHFETQGLAPIQAGQLYELMGHMAGLEGVTILTGDLNSDAAGAPGDDSYTESYGILTSSGFEDAWVTSTGPAKEVGFTCCQDPDLRNGPSVLHERIDFILVRRIKDGTVAGKVLGTTHVEILGDEQEDRVGEEGLWPADHAGLAGLLRLADPAGR